MASTTSDTGDTSSKQQQAQRKENYKSKRPVSITAILTEEKREEKQFTKPIQSAAGIAVDEKQLISAGQERIGQKK